MNKTAGEVNVDNLEITNYVDSYQVRRKNMGKEITKVPGFVSWGNDLIRHKRAWLISFVKCMMTNINASKVLINKHSLVSNASPKSNSNRSWICFICSSRSTQMAVNKVFVSPFNAIKPSLSSRQERMNTEKKVHCVMTLRYQKKKSDCVPVQAQARKTG